MSPSRFSAGMTSGSPGCADQEREGRVDELRLVRHVGMPGRGRVHLLLQHPLVDRARPCTSARRRPSRASAPRGGTRTRRPPGRCAARSAPCGRRPRPRPRPRATPSRRRRRRRPCGRPRSGDGRPPIGTTPGIRRPVRTITWPPISSRRMRFGLPTSPAALGRDRRRLQAEPGLADRRGGLVDDAVLRSLGATRARGRSAAARARARSRRERGRGGPRRAAPGRSRPLRERRSSRSPRAASLATLTLAPAPDD